MSDEGLVPVTDSDDLSFGQTIRGFAVGQKLFGRYTLSHIIGRGGMGLVWLAQDEKLEHRVALKFLPETLRLDSSALDDLKRETRRGLALAHPHIVRIYDFVDDETAAAISMEYIDGRTLSALRVEQASRVYEPVQLQEWTTQLVEALDYAHRRGKIVHRDLKPANLMTTLAGELKVADFGIARSISESVSRVSVRGASSGTLVYMSPQQAQGQAPKAADDIYSMGATLYELITSKPPFFSGNIQHQLDTVVPPSLAERRAELEIEGEPIPEEWEQTVAACLAKDAADRPQSVAQVGEWLGLRAATAPFVPVTVPATTPKTVVARSPATVRGPATVRATTTGIPPAEELPPEEPFWKRYLIPLAAGAVALLLLLGGLGYYFGVAVPAEKARQAQIAKAQADAQVAAEEARAEAAQQEAALAAQKAAEAKNEEEKAAAQKAQQEAEARAAAAEQAEKDAQAAALKAQQEAAAKAAAAATPPPPPALTPEQVAQQKQAATQIQSLIDAKKLGEALYLMQLATHTLPKDQADTFGAPFQAALGPYQQQRDAAIGASQAGDPAAALAQLKAFDQQNPGDPAIIMAMANVETRMPPEHSALHEQLRQFKTLATQEPEVRSDSNFLALQTKFTSELNQLDTLSHRLENLKSAPKGHGNISRLEEEKADAEKKLAEYKMIPPTSILYLTVAASIADKQREINSLDDRISEIRNQPVASDSEVDDAQQKYDDFVAAVPW
jgi:hypothetical protein